jgi:ferritin-like metal-binding protein YciE
MTKTIHIYLVSVEEVNDWLIHAIYEAEGHNQNVIEDFSGFIHSNPRLKKKFHEYLKITERQDEEIH